jgi:hypothetical protein
VQRKGISNSTCHNRPVMIRPSDADCLQPQVRGLRKTKARLPELISRGEPWLAAYCVGGFYLKSTGATATPRKASPARAERIVKNLSR